VLAPTHQVGLLEKQLSIKYPKPSIHQVKLVSKLGFFKPYNLHYVHSPILCID